MYFLIKDSNLEQKLYHYNLQEEKNLNIEKYSSNKETENLPQIIYNLMNEKEIKGLSNIKEAIKLINKNRRKIEKNKNDFKECFLLLK